MFPRKREVEAAVDVHTILLVINGILLLAHFLIWLLEWIWFGSGGPPPPLLPPT
jgi:hypothetical protein